MRPTPEAAARCARHPELHGGACYCGAVATRHVFYGSGCGHVCDEHAAAIRRVKPYARVVALPQGPQR
jgi:hypothetical protein